MDLRKIRENTWKYLCLTGFTFNVSGDLRIHVLNEKIRAKRVFTYLTLNARISRLTRSRATKALLKCGDCGKAILLLLFPGHHTPRRVWDHDEQLFVSIGKEHTPAAKCTECLTKKILRGSFPQSDTQWRAILKTCRECMKYLCSRCDEMQPAAMFGTFTLNNHRRSDRRTVLICSACRDDNQTYALKCSACNTEKLSNNFLVTSVRNYRQGKQKTLICNDCQQLGRNGRDMTLYTCSHCSKQWGAGMYDSQQLKNFKKQRRKKLICEVCAAAAVS